MNKPSKESIVLMLAEAFISSGQVSGHGKESLFTKAEEYAGYYLDTFFPKEAVVKPKFQMNLIIGDQQFSDLITTILKNELTRTQIRKEARNTRNNKEWFDSLSDSDVEKILRNDVAEMLRTKRFSFDVY